MFQPQVIEQGIFEPVSEKGYTNFVFMGGRYGLKYDQCQGAPIGKPLNVRFAGSLGQNNFGKCGRFPNRVLSFEDAK